MLFTTDCRGQQRIEKFYAKVTPLGFFVPQASVVRPFFAFRLEGARGEIGPIKACWS